MDVVSDSAAPEHGPASDEFCGPDIHFVCRCSVAGTSVMAPGLVSAEQRKRMQLETDDDSDVTCKRR